MSGLAAQFLIVAASVETEEPCETPKRQNVAFIMCQGDCLVHTPHKRENGYYECVICQNRIYGKRLVSTLEDDHPG